MIYNINDFTYSEKIDICDDDLKYTIFKCDEHGLYYKYRGISDMSCPWCKKNHDPIENIRELRSQLRKNYNWKNEIKPIQENT